MEKNLFALDGRIRRSTYWTRILISIAINVLVLVAVKYDSSLKTIGLIMNLLVVLFSVIQGVKRMHDVNKSGWYILIPLYNLVLYFTEGTQENNKYGVNPKAINPNEDEINNGLMSLLISAFSTCGVYALMHYLNIFTNETIRTAIFLITFIGTNFYFLTFNINKKVEVID